MSQLTSKERLNNQKDLIEGNYTRKLKEILNPLLIKLTSSKITYNMFPLNELELLDNHPVIFAVNHYCSQDTPIACNAINSHAYIIAGKQQLYPIDELFFNLNGSLFVDRKDKIDMKLSKRAMVEYLKNNKSLIYFPEGTWNLDDAKLMLPIKWGIIDVARNVNAQIVPIVLHYDDSNNYCYIKYEKPILCDDSKDKMDQVNHLRDTMASAKWKLIELSSLVSNKLYVKDKINYLASRLFAEDIDVDKLYDLLSLINREEKTIELLRGKFTNVINEYPPLDYDYEKSIIYEPYDSKEKVFAKIKSLK